MTPIAGPTCCVLARRHTSGRGEDSRLFARPAAVLFLAEQHLLCDSERDEQRARLTAEPLKLATAGSGPPRDSTAAASGGQRTHAVPPLLVPPKGNGSRYPSAQAAPKALRARAFRQQAIGCLANESCRRDRSADRDVVPAGSGFSVGGCASRPASHDITAAISSSPAVSSARVVLALHSTQPAAISLALGTGGLLALPLAAAGLSWSA